MDKVINILKINNLRFATIAILISSCINQETDWKDMLNYNNFSNWDIYVAQPQKKVPNEEAMVDSANHYLAPTGYLSENPQTSVFSFAKVESKPMLIISGELIGFMTTKEAYENYHLKMKFRFGKKWKWLGSRPRDGGIFYPMTDSMGREFNIHDGDIGSFWSFGSIADIAYSNSTILPKSITVITPIIKTIIPSLRDTMPLYDVKGKIDSFGANIPKRQICIANPISDNALGEWNELELICKGDTAIHIVNEKVVCVLYNCRYKSGKQNKPINKGKITFQSEGGEMFVEYIKIKLIEKIPTGLIVY